MNTTREASSKSGSVTTAASPYSEREAAVLSYDDLGEVYASVIASRVKQDFGLECSTDYVQWIRRKNNIEVSRSLMSHRDHPPHTPSPLSPLLASVGWAGSWNGWGR